MGNELVPKSSDEFLDQLVTTVSKSIVVGKLEVEEEERQEKIEKEIQTHYLYLADTTLRKLWKECKKQTGHRLNYDRIGGSVCKFCAKPLEGSEEKKKDRKSKRIEREDRGISKVADQLRSADVAAGVEWRPKWVK